ncbi:hypothetical protein [Aquimarina sp. SS2-1]|uniref:DUF6443 domain-containing protein n=1 Tax=Aquimarina besae TaxID=3342247 RepID=UPI00366D3233
MNSDKINFFINKGFLGVITLICAFSGWAQSPVYSVFENFSSQQIDESLNNTTLVLESPNAGLNANTVVVNPQSFVRISVDADKAPFYWFAYTINLEITPVLKDGSLEAPYNKEFIVGSNPSKVSSEYKDVSEYVLDNKYGVQVKVISIRTKNIENSTIADNTLSSPENVSLDLGFRAKRYDPLSNNIPLVAKELLQENENATNVGLKLKWDAIEGALEYDVEWTWIDNYGSDLSSPLLPENIDLTDRQFQLNSTRISTNENFYEIPLIYDNGYLVYRVRAVGRFMEDVSKKYFGEWSTGASEKTKISNWEPNYYLVTAHENRKNWQFQASYAEEGKKKEVVSYFDGTLRNRQTVTKINSDDNAIVGEVIYDNQGRPAIEVLPVPATDNHIRFYKDFNKNITNNTPYSHLDFDWSLISQDGTPVDNSCNNATDGMSNSTGASQYYGQQPTTGNTFQDYIPDAKNYPFSQIEYTPDNTGRIRRKSGVGVTHQLGSGHEMKYFYGAPEQEELTRLFGNSVGNAIHYKKNVVIDPNGQVSVSFIDPQGRTIATALAAGSPLSLEGLDDEKNISLHKQFTLDLIRRNNKQTSELYPGIEDALVTGKQIIVMGNGTDYNFEYSVTEDISYELECNPGYYYPFVYDLSISLIDDCGEEQLLPEISTTAGTEDFSGAHIAVATPQGAQTPSARLNTGTYALSKVLKIDHEVLDRYAIDYRNKLQDSSSNCYVDPSQFAPSAIFNSCYTTCEECVESLGTKEAYVIDELKGRFINATFEQDGVDAEGFMTVTWEDSNLDVNGAEVIESAEVNALIRTFTREWELIKQACEAPCNAIYNGASCEVSNTTLLQDMKPLGQYGAVFTPVLDENGNPQLDDSQNEITQIQDELSIFNENNKLISPDGNPVTWRTPAEPYKDAPGVISEIVVRINEDGTYTPAIINGVTPNSGTTESGASYEWISPENLADVRDFLSEWREYWAVSLLPYHPENCYLDYATALCDIKSNVDIYDVISGQMKTVPMDSDGFDSYIREINVFDQAEDLGLLSNDDEALMKLDPYFNKQIGLELPSEFNWRKQVMQTALDTRFEDYTNNGTNITLLHFAYLAATCDGLTTCDDTSFNGLSSIDDSLSDSQKNQIWNTYKGSYLSLKERIKTVFRNLYALKNGCYNGCIGNGVNTPSITSVIRNYAIAGTIQNHANTNASANQLCDAQNAELYKDKLKRFTGADEQYDANQDEGDIIEENSGDGDYFNYAQTGGCPLKDDLENFLDQFVKEKDINDNIQSLVGNRIYRGQYLTNDLFEAFGGEVNTLSQLNFEGVVQSNSLNLQSNIVNSCSNLLTLNLPNIGWDVTNTWDNYSPMDGVGWSILNFSQLYYDPLLSNPAQGVFGFQVLAEVIIGADIREFVFTGTTCVAIGECGPEDDGIGEVLDDQVDNNPINNNNTIGCTNRAQFGDDLVNLINELKSRNALNTTTDLSTIVKYSKSIIPEIIGDDIVTPRAVWSYGSQSSDQYDITFDGTVIFSITGPMASFLTNTTANTFTSLYFLPDTNNSNQKLYYTDGSGVSNYFETSIVQDVDYSCCKTATEPDNNCITDNALLNKDFTVLARAIRDNSWHLVPVDGGNGQPGLNIDLSQQGLLTNSIRSFFEEISGSTFTTIHLRNVMDIYDSNVNYIGFVVQENRGEGFYTFGRNELFTNITNCTLNFVENPAGTDYYSFGFTNQSSNTYNQTLLKYRFEETPFYIDSFSEVKPEAICDRILEYDCAISPSFESEMISIGQDLHEINLYLEQEGLYDLYYNGGFSVVDLEAAGKLTSSLRGIFQQAIDNQSITSFHVAKREFGSPNIGIVVNNQYFFPFSIGNYAGPNFHQVTFNSLEDQIIIEGVPHFTFQIENTRSTSQGTFRFFIDFGYYRASIVNDKVVLEDGQFEQFRVPCAVVNDNTDQPFAAALAIPDPKQSSSCDICIPQTVAPIPCQDKYEQFLSDLGINPDTFESSRIEGYTLLDNFYTETNFCSLKFQYIADSYDRYLTDLGVVTAVDPNFLTIAEFGNTNLNYGYDKINDVISAYVAYRSQQNTNPTDDYFWTEFVNNVYLVANKVCPPAPLDATIQVDIADDDTTNCEEANIVVAETYQSDSYQAYLDALVTQFKREYIKKGIDNVNETLKVTYADKEYQYTLYYYDQAGNLVQTIPPEGVNRDEDLSDNISPSHRLQTKYKYNSLNQLVWQSTPDGGETRFAYDKLGRIILSQNAKQKATRLYEYDCSYYETSFPISLAQTNGLGVISSGNFAGSIRVIGTSQPLPGTPNYGGFSNEFIQQEGYIEFNLNIPNLLGDLSTKSVAVGLSYSNVDDSFTTIDYGIKADLLDRRMSIIQQGAADIPLLQQFNHNDKVRIERADGNINFYFNDGLIRTYSDPDPTAAMYIDIGMIGNYAVDNVRLVNKISKTCYTGNYSYTDYDALGRIVEAGELALDEQYSISDTGRLVHLNTGAIVEEVDQMAFPYNLTDKPRSEVTRTQYDTSLPGAEHLFGDNVFTGNPLLNNDITTRNRVTAVLYHNAYAEGDTEYDNAIFYNYDIHGNVKELVCDNKAPELVPIDQNQKRVQYEYDLISGNVHQVIFQADQPDQFIHRYSYDDDNRITSVETSHNGVIWEKDASYQYYAHGPLARVLIGDKKVQGMDYVYTLQGWLKGVNSDGLNLVDDIGKDGVQGSKVARDAMGYSLSYYYGDYQPVTQNVAFRWGTGFNREADKNLYNGNIKMMITDLLDQNEDRIGLQINQYEYDQLNRIRKMQGNQLSGRGLDPNYSAEYEYDRNGNLIKLSRKDQNGTVIDDFNYKYNRNSNGDITNNQLLTVQDKVGKQLDNDLLDQFAALGVPADAFDQNNENHINYIYDDIGQLIRDKTEGLTIDWRVDGKVRSVTKDDGTVISFGYDGLGNRLSKTVVKSDDPNDKMTTYYSRDAQGNVLAVYGTGSDAANCAVTLTLDDEVVTNIGITEKAQADIIVAPTAEYVVESGAMITHKAAEGITWLPGTHAKTGSDVHALIDEVACVNTLPDGSEVMALSLKEHHIYGSSRLGLQESDVLLGTADGTTDDEDLYTNTVGDKRYELSNHLGNVLSVISDRKLVAIDTTNSITSVVTDSDIHYNDTFDTSVGGWTKTTQATGIAIDNGRLAVTTAQNNHGAQSYYWLYAGRTYEIRLTVNRDDFTPGLEIGIWKGSSKLQAQNVDMSGAVTMTFTATSTGNHRLNTRLKETGYAGADQTYYLDAIEIEDLTEGTQPIYVTEFTGGVTPFTASNGTTAMTTEAGRLKVTTGADFNGTNANYYLLKGKTYTVDVDVDVNAFTPPLEIGVWKGNSKLQSDLVTETGTYTTTITVDESGEYRINTRLRENGYNGGDQVYYLDNLVITEVEQNSNITNINNADFVTFTPDVLSFNDYYPFGMLLPNRHGNSSDYRYGFQGQEVDNEIKGEGNSVNFTFRMHDSRVGRFFAVDPLSPQYAHYTPYSFAGNKVIAWRELEGLEESNINDEFSYEDANWFVKTMANLFVVAAKVGDNFNESNLGYMINDLSGNPVSTDDLSSDEKFIHSLRGFKNMVDVASLPLAALETMQVRSVDVKTKYKKDVPSLKVLNKKVVDKVSASSSKIKLKLPKIEVPEKPLSNSVELVSPSDVKFSEQTMIGQRVWAYFNGKAQGFYEMKGNILNIEINLPKELKGKGIGSVIFKEAVDGVYSFKALWKKSKRLYPEKGMSDNLAEYYKNIKNKMSKTDAAWNTWSGRQAKKNGFNKAVVNELEDGDGVEVLFTKE